MKSNFSKDLLWLVSIGIVLLYFFVCHGVTKTGTASTSQTNQTEAPGKPRLLVLTDIGGDPDDQQSLIRLSLYFNEFDMEGFIASASGTPGELGKDTVKPQLIKEIIGAYGKVRPNLLLHDEDFPDSESLIKKIKKGNPHRGTSFIGEGHDTEGSDWIINVVDRKDNRPLNIAIWGGQTDLFQALWKVKSIRSQQAYQEFISRIRIYDIADQDNIYDQMSQNFPGLFYILNKAPKGQDKRKAVFRGMYLGGDESLTSLEWITSNIQQNHGPLGALYPLKTWTAPNPHRVMKEGDTPSWFYFLPNGLGHPAHPEWGGWGGRFTPTPTHFMDAEDTVDGVTSARATVWRWRADFQHDFQARMDWCIKPYDEANHNPIAAFENKAERDIIGLSASPGESLTLDASGSTDPDKDSLSYHWYVYPEAGTIGSLPILKRHRNQRSLLIVPENAVSGESVHIILEVTDDGSPKLTSYRRIIVTVT